MTDTGKGSVISLVWMRESKSARILFFALAVLNLIKGQSHSENA